MRYQVELERKKFISQAAIYYSVYYTKQTNDDFLDGFPNVSQHFTKNSEDSPKVV